VLNCVSLKVFYVIDGGLSGVELSKCKTTIIIFYMQLILSIYAVN